MLCAEDVPNLLVVDLANPRAVLLDSPMLYEYAVLLK